jgi:hypothetical protein
MSLVIEATARPPAVDIAQAERGAGPDAPARARALSFEAPSPGRFALYLVRNAGFQRSSVGVSVGVDGREVARLRSPQFTRVDIAAGSHFVTAFAGRSPALHAARRDLHVTQSAILVLRITQTRECLGARLGVERVALEAVRHHQQRMPMSAPGRP